MLIGYLLYAKRGAEHKNLKDQRPAFCEKLQLFTVGLTV